MNRPYFGLMGLALVAAASCKGNWPASMAVQPSIGPLEGMRSPPVGSVAVGVRDLVETRDDLEDEQSPVSNDSRSAARGGRLFRIHCVACHGPQGRGDGKVSQKMPPAPDLRHIAICRRTDGFIYGTITLGGRAMPALREGLTSRDRWDLVGYVRHLQAGGCSGSAAGLEPTADPGEGDAP